MKNKQHQITPQNICLSLANHGNSYYGETMTDRAIGP